MGDKLS